MEASNKIETGLDNKRIVMNMIFAILTFILNAGINFFITPYITGQFGSEAYGYVKLAGDFVNYASLFSIALNSMASRFIMFEREKGNIKQANAYYSSIEFANIILAVILMIPSVLLVIFLEDAISIPTYLIIDVKITFAVVFANMILNLFFSIYGNCFYLTNRLDINSIRSTESTIIRVASILLLFWIFTPHISFVAIGGTIASIYVCVTNAYYSRKLTPDLKFKIRAFDVSKIITVLSSGIWNSITKLSQIFSSGLDLLVTNLFISSEMMGYLSIAKTVPGIITTFNSTVANVFSPNFMQLYAKNEIQQLRLAAKTSMRVMCIFVAIPNAILITMGEGFFELWVPGQPAKLINTLSVLTVINSCVTGPMQPLYQLFTVTNKVRQSSIAIIIYGFSSIVMTLACLKFWGIGVYAVVGVSLVGSLIVALCYHLPFAAKYIGLPWHTFFPEIGISIISFFIDCIIGLVINNLLNTDTWLMWIIAVTFNGILGLVVSCFLVLNKHERLVLTQIISRKIKRT